MVALHYFSINTHNTAYDREMVVLTAFHAMHLHLLSFHGPLLTNRVAFRFRFSRTMLLAIFPGETTIVHSTPPLSHTHPKRLKGGWTAELGGEGGGKRNLA